MRLRYTSPALADLDAILEYVAARSPQGATRIHARIQAVANLLLSHPRVGTQTDDPTIRRITTSPYPYLIFYEVREDPLLPMPCGTLRAIHPGCREPFELRTRNTGYGSLAPAHPHITVGSSRIRHAQTAVSPRVGHAALVRIIPTVEIADPGIPGAPWRDRLPCVGRVCRGRNNEHRQAKYGGREHS